MSVNLDPKNNTAASAGFHRPVENGEGHQDAEISRLAESLQPGAGWGNTDIKAMRSSVFKADFLAGEGLKAAPFIQKTVTVVEGVLHLERLKIEDKESDVKDASVPPTPIQPKASPSSPNMQALLYSKWGGTH